MLLDSPALERFQRDGFALGPRLLDRAQLDELRAELDRVIADDKKPDVEQPLLLRNLGGNDAHPVWQIVNIWEASDAFRRLLELPALGETIAALIGGREIRLWHDQIQYKPKGIGGTTGWHQDFPAWRTMSDPEAVSAWIALDDADIDNGCMSMVPESHRWGVAGERLREIPPVGEPDAAWTGLAQTRRYCRVPAGCVHFHHSLTWHGSHANTSARPRRAIALHFMNENVKKTIGDHHPCGRYHEGADGEPLRGERFPLVWHDGVALAVPKPGPRQAAAPAKLASY